MRAFEVFIPNILLSKLKSMGFRRVMHNLPYTVDLNGQVLVYTGTDQKPNTNKLRYQSVSKLAVFK